jgi:hypothetical protein
VLMTFLRRRKRGKKRKGQVASVMPFIGAVGEGEGVRCGVRMEERDGRREGGLARRSAAGTGPWPMGMGGLACGAAPSRGGGVTDPWARGHSNGWRGLNRFKFKRI